LLYQSPLHTTHRFSKPARAHQGNVFHLAKYRSKIDPRFPQVDELVDRLDENAREVLKTAERA
jgi:hypothetical protein